MERNFNNNDFEQFLKQNADQYRMHPSEKVWTEIDNTLHPRHRWYGIAALLLLLTGAVVSGVMILNPGSSSQTASLEAKLKTESVIAENNSISNSDIPSAIPVIKNVNQNRTVASKRIPTIVNNYSAEQIEVSVNAEVLMINQNVPTINQVEKIYTTTTTTTTENSDETVVLKSKSNFNSILVSNKVAVNNVDYKKSVSNNTENNKPVDVVAKPSALIADLVIKTPESSSIQKSKTKKNIIWQLYFTPGISYRRLSENKETILAAAGSSIIPSNLALRDVKNLVTHKPDIGFELGLAAKYPLTKFINLKAGFQFNVNKYNIHAFSFVPEPATIAIQGGSSPQSVTSTSYYRNFNGYSPNWLTNVYFSISLPVGLEVNFFNNKKITVGLGLTGQPTYLLDNTAYLISTDFKNYTKVPDLIRRWNLNTGAELIVGFKAGKTKFQVGPQMRYQALSSFKDKYPVRENLFNFGLKAGISLNK